MVELTEDSIRAGTIVDMKELGVWEPYEVKAQTIKTAIESATLLLRIDDIVSGIQKKNKMAPGQSSAPQPEDPDQVCNPTWQCPETLSAGQHTHGYACCAVSCDCDQACGAGCLAPVCTFKCRK